MPPLRPPSCWRPPSWPAKPERTAELQSPARGPTPTQILGGPKMSKKKSVRDYGRIECATQFGARDGAGVQVRGAKRDGDARRRVFAARGVYNLHVQPAADRDAPRGRAARDGKSGGAWGFAARARTAEGCTTQAVVAHAWCTLPPGASSRLDARCICLASCCATRPMQADGGGGKGAPCRRGSSPAPASAKTMADGTDLGGGLE